MGTTPVYALPYPEAVDPADVPTDMHELALAIEAIPALGGGWWTAPDGTTLRTNRFAYSERATGMAALGTHVTGDAGWRWYVTTDGVFNFGAGAGAPDTTFSRQAAGVLGTPGSLNVGANLGVGGLATVVGLQVNGNAAITGALNVAGVATVAGLQVNGNGVVTGNANVGTLTVNGAASVAGLLTLGGLQVNGNAAITGSLSAGATTVAGFTANGNAQINGTMTATSRVSGLDLMLGGDAGISRVAAGKVGVGNLAVTGGIEVFYNGVPQGNRIYIGVTQGTINAPTFSGTNVVLGTDAQLNRFSAGVVGVPNALVAAGGSEWTQMMIGNINHIVGGAATAGVRFGTTNDLIVWRQAAGTLNISNPSGGQAYLTLGGNEVSQPVFQIGVGETARFRGFQTNPPEQPAPALRSYQCWGYGMDALTWGYGIMVNGLVGAGGFPIISDERMKRNLRPIAGAVAALRQIRTISFEWQPKSKHGTQYDLSDGRHIGVIAQDVKKVYPDVVSEQVMQAQDDKDGQPVLTGDTRLAVDYGRLVAPLIAAVHELDTRLAQLEGAA